MKIWKVAALITFVILFIIFPFWLYHDLTRFFGFQHRWMYCLEDLAEGKLYAGEPRCGDPPLYFLTSYLLYAIAGNSFQFLVQIMIVGLNAVLFLLLWKISQREGMAAFPLLAVLYIPIIYFFSLSHFETIQATVLLFAGFYVLYHTEHRSRFLLSGLIFALALLTKLTISYALLSVLVYYVLIRASKESISQKVLVLAKVLVPIPIMFSIASLFYPHFLDYSYFSHVIAFSLPFSTTLLQFLPLFSFTSVLHLIFVFTLLAPLYTFYKYRDVYSFTAFSSFLLTFISASSVLTGAGVRTYYLIPTFPFTILVFHQLWKPIKKFRPRFFFVIFLLLFLAPFYSWIYLEEQVSDLHRLVWKGLDLIPLEQGRILQVQEKGLLSKYRFPDRFEYDEIEYIGYYDDIHGPGLEALGLLNLPRWQEAELYAKFPPLIEKISAGYYDAIIIDVVGPQSQIFKAVRLADAITPGFPYPCMVYVPTAQDRCQTCDFGVRVLMKDKALCASFKAELYNYYTKHFQDICRMDEVVANKFIGKTMRFNRIPFEPRCSPGGDLLQRYQRRGRLLPWKGFFSKDVAEPANATDPCTDMVGALEKVGERQIGFFMGKCVWKDLISGNMTPYCLQCQESFCEIYEKNNLITDSLGVYHCNAIQRTMIPPVPDAGNPLERNGVDSTACYNLFRLISYTGEARRRPVRIVPELCSPELFTVESQASALYWRQSPQATRLREILPKSKKGS